MRLARGFSSASCSDSLPFKPEPKDQTTSTRPNRLVSELRNETLWLIITILLALFLLAFAMRHWHAARVKGYPRRPGSICYKIKVIAAAVGKVH
jgi:uncharacterized integral membrane protein